MNATGYVDRLRQPRTKLTVKGNRKSARLEPVIDTGFDGELSLPIAVAIPLGLELCGRVPVELADGSWKNELVFFGSVIWRERERPIKIFLTDSKDALIGSGLMPGQKLAIDYANRVVTIESAAVAKPDKTKNRRAGK